MDPVSLASTAAAVLVVAVLAVVTALAAGQRRLGRRLAEARSEVETLRSRLEDLARDRRAQPVPGATDAAADGETHPRATPDYLVTRLPAAANAPLGGREFASVALGESLLRLATLAHGIRRAASAENRNRIGFEMRREVKRSRRQRRRDTRDLLRADRQPDRNRLVEDVEDAA